MYFLNKRDTSLHFIQRLREHAQDENVHVLYTNPQGSCWQILNIFCTIEWLGCKHFERFIFEVVEDQVAPVT